MTPLFSRLDALPPLSPEERQLLDSVRALARDEIAPRAAAYDRSGEFPWDNVKAINALGLNAMFVPEAYGGAGLTYAAYLACVREISACASTGIIWATNFHAIKPLIDFGTEEQKRPVPADAVAGGLAALAITEPDRRLRTPRAHDDALHPGRRPHRRRRRQDVHHQWRCRRPHPRCSASGARFPQGIRMAAARSPR